MALYKLDYCYYYYYYYAVSADISPAWLAGESAGYQMVLDICCDLASTACHNTHLYGPADHSRHCQPQGKQTAGECLSQLSCAADMLLLVFDKLVTIIAIDAEQHTVVMLKMMTVTVICVMMIMNVNNHNGKK